MDGSLLSWQLEYAAELEGLNDMELFEELLMTQCPDDHPGRFTGRGRWQRDYCVREFRRRLNELAAWAEPN